MSTNPALTSEYEKNFSRKRKTRKKSREMKKEIYGDKIGLDLSK